MTQRFLNLFRSEDALLIAWGLVGLPLLGLLVSATTTSADPNGGPFGLTSPLRGLVYVLGTLSALVALGTRTAADPARGTPPGALVAFRSTPAKAADPSIIAGHAAILGPLFGGVLFLSIRGLTSLGMDDAPLPIVCLGVAAALVLQASGRAPVVRPAVRRLLVAPFVLAGPILFNALIGGIGIGPSLLGDILASSPPRAATGSPGDTASFALFVFGLVTAGAAVFYTMLVAAPRIMVEREGSGLAWLVRFAAWYGGTIAGLGWVAAIGR